MSANAAAPREHWASRTAFVFAAIGSAIGLGNVWRFPRICAENGGFAFLIAFVVALFTAGIPILILELSMGERTQKATPGAFRVAHREYEWFGWVVVGVGFLITCYYAVVMSWCCSYVFYSATLAWKETEPSAFFFNDFLKLAPASDLPAKWSDLFKGWGGFSWQIFAGAFFSWIFIMACIWRGVKTVSKVVYFTVLVPWFILIAFVIYGLTLDGAGAGLAYYLLPEGEWTKYLLDPSTWIQAYTQVFFSLSIGFGIMFAYGSFLDRETDIVKNAFIIGIADSLTAFVAGLAVFCALGYLSTPEGGGAPIESWQGSSLGIAFIAYPTLIAKIPFGFVLGPLFFVMLLLLAIDSAFSLVEAVIKPFEDKFAWSHKLALFVICGLGLLFGVPFMFQSGLYWFDTLDHFMNHFGLAMACLLECLIFGHIYQAERIRAELLEHRENHLGKWWDWMVRYVSPVVLAALLLWEVMDRVSGSYEGYGRTVEFWGGWAALLLLAIAATVLTNLKGSKEYETRE